MKRTAAALLLLLGAALLASRSEARPGDGQSYSGGSSRGGGSDGSSGGGGGSSSPSSSPGSTVVITGGNPAAFMILFVGVIVFCGAPLLLSIYDAAQDRRDWEYRQTKEVERRARERESDPAAALRQADPDFSAALFDDFVRSLFVRAHRARHDLAALSRLAPYLGPRARARLHARPPAGTAVTSVVLGAVRPGPWRLDEVSHRFLTEVEIEADLHLGERMEAVRETWTLERSARARTRPWEGPRSFGCPNCGAPLEVVAEELCQACGQEVRPARFDWTATQVVHQGTELASTLLGMVPERGTDAPTLVDPGFEAAREALLAEDPAALDGFEARLHLVFQELYLAWSAQDLAGLRPCVSAGLYPMLQQQIQTYRGQGLVNVVDGARILRWDPVKLVRDAAFDALTVRLFATGCDYTYVKATRQVVAGSRERERPYSEYWTLIRGTAAQQPAAGQEPSCPRCAGPLPAGMEGACAHCGSVFAAADFDWVLSGIEQDDVYRG